MDECPICLEILENDIVTMNCCRQKIHHKCAIQWMSHQLNCPMCRYNYQSVVTTPDLVIQDRKPYLFRNIFALTMCMTAVIIPCGVATNIFLP